MYADPQRMLGFCGFDSRQRLMRMGACRYQVTEPKFLRQQTSGYSRFRRMLTSLLIFYPELFYYDLEASQGCCMVLLSSYHLLLLL